MTRAQYVGALAVLAATGLIAGASPDWVSGRRAYAQDDTPDAIQARAFCLVDEEGLEHARLALADGHPVLEFSDGGKLRMRLGWSRTVAGPRVMLGFYDRSGKLRVGMGALDQPSETAPDACTSFLAFTTPEGDWTIEMTGSAASSGITVRPPGGTVLSSSSPNAWSVQGGLFAPGPYMPIRAYAEEPRPGDR